MLYIRPTKNMKHALAGSVVLMKVHFVGSWLPDNVFALECCVDELQILQRGRDLLKVQRRPDAGPPCPGSYYYIAERNRRLDAGVV